MKHSKLIVKHNINPNISHIALTSFTFCHNNSRLRGITVTFRLWKFAVGFHPAEKIRLKNVNFHMKLVSGLVEELNKYFGPFMFGL